MNGRLISMISGLILASSLFVPPTLEAQLLGRLRRAAAQAAEDEVTRQVEDLVRDGVVCAFTDAECIRSGNEAGDDVYMTDEEGNVVVDEDGNPVTEPGRAAEVLGRELPPPSPPAPRPGEGAWANYDFVPGEEILLIADYADDNVGDFPRRFELISGSFEVVEWQGERYVRGLSGGILAIPLPKTLPDRFTLETFASVQHGNGSLRIIPGRAYFGPVRDYQGSVVSVQHDQAGVLRLGDGPESMAFHDAALVRDGVVALRVMADGEHMKVYLGERRVANVPNAVYPRSDTLFVAMSYAYEELPVMMGPVRIASGGADLYDRLSRERRVATQGILFDTDSDVIRPESTPTLQEIGTMLRQHPDLRIAIEGHTDSDGDEAYNLDLSERRAAAVREFLTREYGLESGRLESSGFGESSPAAPNDTPEGKQQNRRVELVRLG